MTKTLLRLSAALALSIAIVTQPAAASDTHATTRQDLAPVKRWGYQLQGLDPLKVADSPFDLMVLDASRDGTRNGAYRPQELDTMRRKPDGGKRLLMAYFSIGEAEDYRGYWRAEWATRPPAWLGAENPAWPGNYPVKFWQDEWQRIILAQLDRIITAGFDGIYLDRVDVYWELKEAHPNAEKDMIAFVQRLARYARNKKPGFVVIAQNAESLLRHHHYAATLDAIGKEDLLYGIGGDGVRNSDEQLYWSHKYLSEASAKGLPVFVIEYLDDPTRKADASNALRRMGFVPLFSTRALDRLPPPAP